MLKSSSLYNRVGDHCTGHICRLRLITPQSSYFIRCQLSLFKFVYTVLILRLNFCTSTTTRTVVLVLSTTLPVFIRIIMILTLNLLVNICDTVISLARALTTPCAKGKVGFHPSYTLKIYPLFKQIKSFPLISRCNFMMSPFLTSFLTFAHLFILVYAKVQMNDQVSAATVLISFETSHEARFILYNTISIY